MVVTATLLNDSGASTGCPEVQNNFDTQLFSGMPLDIRLIFGVLNVWMVRFNYMYKI